MRVNSARNLDYWLGIPICFILSILQRICRIFNLRSFEEHKPKKIMFLELSEIGSTILAYPAMKKIKDCYPEVKLYFWTFKENQDVIYLLKIVPKENIITIRTKNFWLLFIDTLKNLYRIRREKIDIIIDFEFFSRFSSILSYISGAKLRVGFYGYTLQGLYRGNLLTHKVLYNPYIHISKNFNNLVASLNESLEDLPLVKKSYKVNNYQLPRIDINVQEEQGIWTKLKKINNSINKNNKIIIIHYGFDEKIAIRGWSIEYYSELIKRLLNEKNIYIILIGIEPKGKNLYFESQRCINLIGKTTIKTLIELFNISNVLISHDCGIIHIASLTDIYIIAMFGPETPILYEPLAENKIIFYKRFNCSPCISAYNYKNSICKDNKCMQAITVDEVYKQVLKKIEE